MVWAQAVLAARWPATNSSIQQRQLGDCFHHARIATAESLTCMLAKKHVQHAGPSRTSACRCAATCGYLLVPMHQTAGRITAFERFHLTQSKAVGTASTPGSDKGVLSYHALLSHNAQHVRTRHLPPNKNTCCRIRYIPIYACLEATTDRRRPHSDLHSTP